MSLSLFGCGGDSVTATTPSAISGKVSFNGAGLSGVTVAMTGAATNNLTTDGNGGYSVSGVQNGEYTLTPSIAGFTFSPVSQTITVANNKVTVPEFTATAISSSFTVSGRVTQSGTGLAGVFVTITGAGSGSTTTDSAGNYSFTGVRNGNCTITPSAAGHTFAPFSRAITVSNRDVTVPDFTATAVSSSFTVSGRVSGTVLSGVTLNIAIPGGFVIGSLITGDNGTYTFTGVLNGDYTITPALTGYEFAPASRTFAVSNGNVSGQDFTASPSTTGSITVTF